MRLINVRTFRLEEFFDPLPRYAILSHTWGNPSQEVTFQEFNDPGVKTKEKPGYKKIEMCARLAQGDKLEYCWVDTCCIDKTSSAELSEAINSMFKWYRDAVLCYVHLADVENSPGTPRMFLEEQITRSRWFTRGWTLQELLAPRVRIFLDKTWQMIGRLPGGSDGDNLKVNGFTILEQLSGAGSGDNRSLKGSAVHEDSSNGPQTSSLAHLLSMATGISEQVLLSETSQDYPVAVKMRWASRRQTTRPEDMAYCLLGLFDVQMPLLYGEGEKAFLRLQEEIIRKKVDHTIFAWRLDKEAPKHTFHGLLSPSPKYFAGTYSNIEATGSKTTSSYEMTNNGLHIELPIYRHKGQRIAILDIKQRDRCAFVIMVNKLNDEGQYARVDAQESLLSGPDYPALPTLWRDARRTWIYVRQDMDQIPSRVDAGRLSRIMVKNNVRDRSVIIKHILTPGEFDKRTLSFAHKVSESTEARIMLEIERPSSSMAVWWWIQDNDGSISSRLAGGGDSSNWEGLQWRSTVIPERTKRGSIIKFMGLRTDLSFKVLRGELVAEVGLNAYNDSAGAHVGPRRDDWM